LHLAPESSRIISTSPLTHSAGGITDKDFALAQKIEEVVLWRPAQGGPLEGTPNKFVQGKK
jgi:4a-hydroxytetrahydrobiopterin dehydratase